MAITVANQLTTFIDCEDDTNWAGSDATIGEDTDIYKVGSTSIAWDTDIETYYAYYDALASTDLSSRAIYFWFLSLTAPYLDTWEEGGIGIRLEDSAGNWSEWWLGGVDNYFGGWKRFCFHTDSSPDDQSVSAPDLTDIDILHVRVKALTKSKLGDNTFVDHFEHDGGNTVGLQVTTSAEVADWADILAGAGNDSGGIVRVDAGVYYVLGPIQFGDASSGDIQFADTNQVIIAEDLYRTFTVTSARSAAESLVPQGHFKILLEANGGTSEWQLGIKSGTQGISGCVLKSADAGSKLELDIDDPDIDDLLLYGCTFISLGQIDLPVDAVDRECISCAFSGCGEIIAETCDFEYCNVVSSVNVGVQLDDKDNVNLLKTNFIACAVALEVTQSGEITLVDCQFTGNVVDIWNSSGGPLQVNASGTSDPVTSSGEVTIISTKTHTLIGLVPDSKASYIRRSDMVLLFEEDPVGGGGEVAYSYNYAGDVDVDIHIQHLDYQWQLIELTLGGTDQTLPVTQVEDSVYSNP